MANFKALSSGFVFGFVLLLLVVVLNVYPAAAAGCSNSSVVLFKSLPLKVVEEVAKDQRTTTEIAIDDHHEIQERRILQGVGSQVWKLLNKFRSPIKGAKTAYKSYNNLNTGSNDLEDYLDKYCVFPYCYPSTPGSVYCLCQEEVDQTKPPCINLKPLFYCCEGSTDGTCSSCCVGKDGSRNIRTVTTTTSPSSTTPTGVSSVSSSSQSPIAYVAMATVIASVILV